MVMIRFLGMVWGMVEFFHLYYSLFIWIFIMHNIFSPVSFCIYGLYKHTSIYTYLYMSLVDRVCYFLDELSLSINASKSFYIVFRKSKNKEVNQNIYIKGRMWSYGTLCTMCIEYHASNIWVLYYLFCYIFL